MLFILCMLKIRVRFISFHCTEMFTEVKGGTQYMHIREGVSARNFQATQKYQLGLQRWFNFTMKQKYQLILYSEDFK